MGARSGREPSAGRMARRFAAHARHACANGACAAWLQATPFALVFLLFFLCRWR